MTADDAPPRLLRANAAVAADLSLPVLPGRIAGRRTGNAWPAFAGPIDLVGDVLAVTREVVAAARRQRPAAPD